MKTLRAPLSLLVIAAALLALLADAVLSASPASGSGLAQFIGRTHPLAVHLPIGFLLLVVCAEALSLLPSRRADADAIAGLGLPLAVLSGAASFVLGHLLAAAGGVPEGPLTWHRRLTLVFVLLAALTTVVFTAMRQTSSSSPAPRLAYQAMLTVTTLVLSIGAHHGGSLSRGENYLTEHAPEFVKKLVGHPAPPKPNAESGPAQPSADPLLYAAAVVPILEKHCIECHGEAKHKGKLRLDSIEAMLSGGSDDGPAIVAGASGKSPLLLRIHLADGDDRKMPPDGRSVLSEAEIATLAFFIDSGASPDLRIRQALPPKAARPLLEALVDSAASPVPSAAPSAEPGRPPSAEPSAEPAPDPTSEPAANPGASWSPPSGPTKVAPTFTADILPIMLARCVTCHGNDKQKGKLRVDTLQHLLTGGRDGPAVVAGKPGVSTLVSRVKLPLADSDHMPPEDEPQLSAAEIKLISDWIAAGAHDAPAPVASSSPSGGADPSSASGPDGGGGSPANAGSTSSSGSSSAETSSGASSGGASSSASGDLPNNGTGGTGSVDVGGNRPGGPGGTGGLAAREGVLEPIEPVEPTSGCASCTTGRATSPWGAAAALLGLCAALLRRKLR